MIGIFAGATHRALTCAIAMAAAGGLSGAAAALPTQSWNGYHWARTGPLAVILGTNVSATWAPYVATAARGWTTSFSDFVEVAGSTAPTTCNPVFGTVQVCSGNYGRNGWLGYATVYAAGTVILEATVKLNDYYFNAGGYDTAAWKAQTACQEIGHTLGLAHNDTIRTDLNKGTCMDYSNDPTGTASRGNPSVGNGTLANLTPGLSDFAALAQIYSTPDATQLAMTKPGYRAGDAYSIGRAGPDTVQSLPEPTTWTLLIAGFGGIGARLRRRRTLVVA